MIDAVATEQPGSASDPGVEPRGDGTGFSVRLDEFEGPFDLLLSLIAKHRLDVTVLALHTVIDDFLAHIRARGPEWDLDEATEFLVVAATLLDLKAARLLPSGEVEDEEDLALLEARDMLFARLLQYRAYKRRRRGSRRACWPVEAAPSARGGARPAVRRPAARGADRPGPGGVRGSGGAGAGAQAGAAAVGCAHPRARG